MNVHMYLKASSNTACIPQHNKSSTNERLVSTMGSSQQLKNGFNWPKKKKERKKEKESIKIQALSFS